MANQYEVVVSHVGKLSYKSKKLAYECYNAYVTLSKRGETRAAGEDVTLLRNGEMIKQHKGIRIKKNKDPVFT